MYNYKNYKKDATSCSELFPIRLAHVMTPSAEPAGKQHARIKSLLSLNVSNK